MNLLFQKQSYALVIFGQAKNESEVPTGFKNLEAETVLNDSFIDSNMQIYHLVLKLYYIAKTNELYKKNKNDLVLSFSKTIPQNHYSPMMKEHFSAYNIQRGLFMNGITPSIDSIWRQFKIDFGKSKYISTIQREYNKWLVLSKGTLAPNIIGSTPDGKTLSLYDLKGKVVYVDVWATWCQPCREEFPASKRLQKQFENNSQIAFLYVSIDRQKNDWLLFLKGKEAPKGVHINLTETQTDSLFQTYLLSGVPRYILIDKDSKIVAANAARPSSGKVEKLIDELLNTKKEIASK
jgi:thiol-disulfide isomerase/thioredoxin